MFGASGIKSSGSHDLRETMEEPEQMARILYSTKESFKSPWLLTSEALDSLDLVVATEWKRLVTALDAKLESERESQVAARSSGRREEGRPWTSDEEDAARSQIEAELVRSYEFRKKRSLRVGFKSGRSLDAENFAEVRRNPHVQSDLAQEFDLKLSVGELSAKIELSRRVDTLDISVEPNDHPESGDLFLALCDWARKHRAPLWQRIWRALFEAQTVPWTVLFFVCLISLVAAVDSPGTEAKAEARELLASGVESDDQQRRAISLLLAIASGYRTDDARARTIPGWWIVMAVAGSASCLILSFPPRVHLAIGKGASRIAFWQTWSRVVGVVIPTLIVSSFVWEPAVGLVKALLDR